MVYARNQRTNYRFVSFVFGGVAGGRAGQHGILIPSALQNEQNNEEKKSIAFMKKVLCTISR